LFPTKRKELNGMSEQLYVTREALENAVNRVEDRMTAKIEKVESRVGDHDKCIAKVETTLAQFEDLPSILSSLNVTLVRLDGRLCNVEEGIKGLREKTTVQSQILDSLDEKGKIDWIETVKKNWWSIIIFIAAIVMLLKSQGVF